MSNEATVRAGDRAFTKVGRNLVEVRVVGKAEGGWNVTSRTGRTMLAKTLLNADGSPLADVGEAAPAAPKKETAKPRPCLLPRQRPSPRRVSDS